MPGPLTFWLLCYHRNGLKSLDDLSQARDEGGA